MNQETAIPTRRKGAFTLVEILVVIALIAILATITFVALNPAKNFQDANNATRRAGVTEILSAISQYTIVQGNTLAGLGTIPLCSATPAAIGSGVGNVNLATALVDTYIVSIPTDPTTGTAADTGYTIRQSAGGRVTIAAPDAEGGVVISVSR